MILHIVHTATNQLSEYKKQLEMILLTFQEDQKLEKCSNQKERFLF